MLIGIRGVIARPGPAERLHTFSQSTCRHCGETLRKSFVAGLLESTIRAHESAVTRSKSGTCVACSRPYLGRVAGGEGIGLVPVNARRRARARAWGRAPSQPRAQASVDPRTSPATRVGKAIARLVHLAVAQRGAEREAGQRAGWNRSARSSELRGAATLRRDGSRSFRAGPTGNLPRQPVAQGRKTKEQSFGPG